MRHPRILVPLGALASLAALGLLAWTSAAGGIKAPIAAVLPASPTAEPEPPAPRADLAAPTRAPQAADPARDASLTEPAAPDRQRATDQRDATRAARRPMPAAFTVTGSVLDEETREPVQGALVIVASGDRALQFRQADGQGRFHFELEDETATYVVVQPPEGWTSRRPRRELPPIERGASIDLAFELLRWPPPVAGDIRGVLQSERGTWSAEDLPDPGAVVLDLVSTSEPRIELRARMRAEADGQGGHWIAFEFKDVPRGEYELTLSSLDSYRWHPTSTFVSPPAEGLAFLRYDLDRSLPLAFRVLDATTGAPIEDFNVRHLKTTVSSDNGVLLHTGPLEPDRFPLDAAFEWSVWADGYAPAFGDQTSFRIEGESRVAEVRLARGWGARFLVMGGRGTMLPISGATILLDGDIAGTSKDGGVLDVRLDTAPESLAVRYLDWKLKHDPLVPWQGRPPERRGQVIPVMLEPPD